MGDRRVSHTTLAGVALSSDLDALVPFWHSSLLDAQTDAERYALPVVSAPKNARQALKIDMVSAYALSRRLRVSTIGELFALLDKKTEESFKNRGLALRKLETEIRTAVPFHDQTSRLMSLLQQASNLGGSKATEQAVAAAQRGRERRKFVNPDDRSSFSSTPAQDEPGPLKDRRQSRFKRQSQRDPAGQTKLGGGNSSRPAGTKENETREPEARARVPTTGSLLVSADELERRTAKADPPELSEPATPIKSGSKVVSSSPRTAASVSGPPVDAHQLPHQGSASSLVSASRTPALGAPPTALLSMPVLSSTVPVAPGPTTSTAVVPLLGSGAPPPLVATSPRRKWLSGKEGTGASNATPPINRTGLGRDGLHLSSKAEATAVMLARELAAASAPHACGGLRWRSLQPTMDAPPPAAPPQEQRQKVRRRVRPRRSVIQRLDDSDETSESSDEFDNDSDTEEDVVDNTDAAAGSLSVSNVPTHSGVDDASTNGRPERLKMPPLDFESMPAREIDLWMDGGDGPREVGGAMQRSAFIQDSLAEARIRGAIATRLASAYHIHCRTAGVLPCSRLARQIANERVELQRQQLGARGLSPAFSSGMLRTTHYLDLSDNRLGTEGAVAFAIAALRGGVPIGIDGHKAASVALVHSVAEKNNEAEQARTGTDGDDDTSAKHTTASTASERRRSSYVTNRDLSALTSGDGAAPPLPLLSGVPGVAAGTIALPLTSLNLSENSLSGGGAAAIAAVLAGRALPRLKLFVVSSNGLDDAAIVPLFCALPPTITSVDASRNKLGDAAALAIAGALLGHSGLGPAAAARSVAVAAGGGGTSMSNLPSLTAATGSMAAYNTPATSYYNSGSTVASESAAATSALATPVSASENSSAASSVFAPLPTAVTAAAAAALAAAVATSRVQLRTIELSWNRIGAHGAHALSDAIKAPTSRVERLAISFNRLGPRGAMRIAESIASSRSLRHVTLDENRLDTEAALIIANALQLNRNLTTLTVSQNAIGPIGIRALLRVVNAKSHSFLVTLGLVGCAPCVEPLAEVRGGDGSGKMPAGPGYKVGASLTLPAWPRECSLRSKYLLDLSDPFDHAVAEMLRVRTVDHQGGRFRAATLDNRPCNPSRWQTGGVPEHGVFAFSYQAIVQRQLFFGTGPSRSSFSQKGGQGAHEGTSSSTIHSMDSRGDRKSLHGQMFDGARHGSIDVRNGSRRSIFKALLKTTAAMHVELTKEQQASVENALAESSRVMPACDGRVTPAYDAGAVGLRPPMKGWSTVTAGVVQQAAFDHATQKLSSANTVSTITGDENSVGSLTTIQSPVPLPRAGRGGARSGRESDVDGNTEPTKAQQKEDDSAARREEDVRQRLLALDVVGALRPLLLVDKRMHESGWRARDIFGSKAFNPHADKTGGSLDIDAFLTVFARAHIFDASEVSPEEAKKLCEFLDTDGDGKVDIDELDVVLRSLRQDVITLRSLGHLRVEEFLRQQAHAARLIVHARLNASTSSSRIEIAYVLDSLLTASSNDGVPRWKELTLNGSSSTFESSMLTLLKCRFDEKHGKRIDEAPSAKVPIPEPAVTELVASLPTQAIVEVDIVDENLGLHAHYAFDLSQAAHRRQAVEIVNSYLSGNASAGAQHSVAGTCKLCNAQIDGTFVHLEGFFSMSHSNDNDGGADDAGDGGGERGEGDGSKSGTPGVGHEAHGGLIDEVTGAISTASRAHSHGNHPTLYLPLTGLLEFDVVPEEAYHVLTEAHGYDLSDPVDARKAGLMHRRILMRLGEAAWNATLNGAPVSLQALRALPPEGRLCFTYIMTRPKTIALCMRTNRYEFDLADFRQQRQAMYLKQHTLELRGDFQTLWRNTSIEDTEDISPVHMCEASNMELWSLPAKGILRLEFVFFELHGPIQISTNSIVVALIQELPGDRDRLQMLEIIFDDTAEMWVTCAMLILLLDSFTFPASKRDAFELLGGHISDIHNTITIEQHMYPVFKYLEDPISHSAGAHTEQRLGNL